MQRKALLPNLSEGIRACPKRENEEWFLISDTPCCMNRFAPVLFSFLLLCSHIQTAHPADPLRMRHPILAAQRPARRSLAASGALTAIPHRGTRAICAQILRTDEARFCGNTGCIAVKSQQSQNVKFPQSAAAFLVRCCLIYCSPVCDLLPAAHHDPPWFVQPRTIFRMMPRISESPQPFGVPI